MNFQELRIGNRVLNNDVEIEVILDTFYWVTECVMNESDYQPIPLTEDWLVKLGFDKDNTIYNIGIDKKGSIYWSERGILYISESIELNYAFQSECKYVHQLQNLYFALTQKELIIKE